MSVTVCMCACPFIRLLLCSGAPMFGQEIASPRCSAAPRRIYVVLKKGMVCKHGKHMAGGPRTLVVTAATLRRRRSSPFHWLRSIRIFGLAVVDGGVDDAMVALMTQWWR